MLCNTAVSAEDTTLCSKRDYTSDDWDELELVNELKSECQKFDQYKNQGKLCNIFLFLFLTAK